VASGKILRSKEDFPLCRGPVNMSAGNEAANLITRIAISLSIHIMRLICNTNADWSMK